MAIKTYKAEQIVTLVLQIEVNIGNGIVENLHVAPVFGAAPCRYLRVSGICTYKSTTYGGGRMRATATKSNIANLAPGEHKVRIVLVDATHNPFPSSHAAVHHP